MSVATFSKPPLRAIYIAQRLDGAWIVFAARRPWDVTAAELAEYADHGTEAAALIFAKAEKKRTGLPLIPKPIYRNRGGSFAPDGGTAA